MSSSAFKESTDKELIQLMRQDNELAFTELYRRYWERLFLYAYKIFEDTTTCEDIIQEVFIKLWNQRATVDIRNVEGYLFKAVKYQVSNAIRNLKWTVDHELALATTAEQHGATVSLELSELTEQIDQSIERLPDRCREVFLLSRKQELSNQEIAIRLGISVRTVETHIHHALRLLRQNLTEIAMSFLLFHLYLG